MSLTLNGNDRGQVMLSSSLLFERHPVMWA
jgi:hypothetical protein